ncbi:MAG: ABC transporter permease [Nitriliruptoraceae bacterium]|nr:ABC transporter permease [Nitriliruptoraceae bacterium]
MSATTTAPDRGGSLTVGVRQRRFEPGVVAAIVYREWRVFRRVWFSTAFGSIVEPIVFFVGFGFGFGALISEVAGLSYLEFMATGTIAIGIMFSALFPGLINGYSRRTERHLYDGQLAAPVTVAEIVAGESLWNGLRVSVVAMVTVGVAFAFGVRMGPGVVFIPLIAIISGFGLCATGAAFAAKLRSWHGVDIVVGGLIAPMFVVAGTFFPLDGLPRFAELFGRVNPLYHCVELLRAAAFGGYGLWQVLGHLGAVLLFNLLAWLVAVRFVRQALID